MVIAIIADDKKKELTVEFCIAYCGIITKHKICATNKTAKYISEATGMKIESLLSGSLGGAEQIASRIAYNEIDLVIYFKDTSKEEYGVSDGVELMRMCDVYNIPVATNIATAEILVRALDRGDLDWRDFVNPRSDFNKKKAAK